MLGRMNWTAELFPTDRNPFSQSLYGCLLWIKQAPDRRKEYMKRTLLIAAVALIAVGAAKLITVKADSSTINFEPTTYALGSIDGQDGWSSFGSAGHGCAQYDHAVSATAPFAGAPASFATQSLRISNAVTSGCFGDQTFSKSLTQAAGETGAQGGSMSAAPTKTHFEVSFDLASTTPAYQPGLLFSTSPDRGDGARMSYLRFEDQPDGIHVFFDDYRDNAPFGGAVGDPAGCDINDDFSEVGIGTVSRGKHNFRLVMDFVDGPRNDVVKAYIDGVLQATGTSWEDYFRYCEGNPTRTVDSELFRTGGPAAPANAGMGFLVDNLGMIPCNAPSSADACKNNGWQTRSRNDQSVFKNQGDCIQYVNTGK